MIAKNKIVLIIVSFIIILFGIMLYSLRLVLSEDQMKEMVTTFIAREVKGAKGEISEVHLNFRRTLEIHLTHLKVKGPDGLDVGAERVMLSIPYGNFIFRRGKFDVRVTNAEVAYSQEMSSNGAIRALELMESIPQIVGLKGEVNLKLSDPVFTPSPVFVEHYRPEVSRLVINNIGRSQELAVEVIGDLVEDENKRPFTLIGSINLIKKTVNSTLNVEKLNFPAAGYEANNLKLNISLKNDQWSVSGESEDLVLIDFSWLQNEKALTVKKLFFPIANGPLRQFWSGQHRGEGLSFSGQWSGGADTLEIDKSELHLSLNQKEYQATVSGEVGPESQEFVVDFWLPSEKGMLRIDLQEDRVREIELYAQGIDLTAAAEHELFKRIKELPLAEAAETQYQAVFEDVIFDQYVVSGKLNAKGETRSLDLRLAESKAVISVREKTGSLQVVFDQVPCRLIALLLTKDAIDGNCSGEIKYQRQSQLGSFTFRWEPEGSLVEITKLSPLAIAGGLEQLWSVKGKIRGDEISIDSIGGRRFFFEGEAKGSLSARKLVLRGILKNKKQTIAPVNIEISKLGVRVLTEEETP